MPRFDEVAHVEGTDGTDDLRDFGVRGEVQAVDGRGGEELQKVSWKKTF